MKPVAILTGASSGMGKASIIPLSEAGFSLVLAARRMERLTSLAEEVTSRGGNALAVETDLRHEASTLNLFRRTMESYGRLDLLVNVAGMITPTPLEHATREMMRQEHELNAFAPAQLMSLAIPVMREQGGGRIINVTSAASFLAPPAGGLYGASKASIERFTDVARMEVAKFNIKVSSVISGNVQTPMSRLTVEAIKKANPEWIQPSSPYYCEALNFAQMVEEIFVKSKRPELIARCILHAATAKRPKTRYYAPFDAKIQCLIGRAIPVALSSFLLRKALAKKPKKVKFDVDFPEKLR